MDDALKRFGEIKKLKDPLFIGSLSGFTDSTGAATTAVDHLIDVWNAQLIAEIDSEHFFDFTVQRPRVGFENGNRVINWPENKFYIASPEGAERDFILLSGVEPHLRWRQFSSLIVNFIEELGSSMSITLGAQPSGVPHTRPMPLSLSASDTSFETLFGLKSPSSRYQGQTGIVAVLNLALRAKGWLNASLWAMVPHYINAGPNPNVAITLIELIDRSFGTSTDIISLREDAEKFEEQILSVLSASDEAGDYVRHLEQQFDSNRPPLPSPDDRAKIELPDAQDLLGDLEKFLKDQRETD